MISLLCQKNTNGVISSRDDNLLNLVLLGDEKKNATNSNDSQFMKHFYPQEKKV